jgi:hypothetical protein
MTGLSLAMLRGVIIHQVGAFNIANIGNSAKFLLRSRQTVKLNKWMNINTTIV